MKQKGGVIAFVNIVCNHNNKKTKVKNLILVFVVSIYGKGEKINLTKTFLFHSPIRHCSTKSLGDMPVMLLNFLKKYA